MKKNLQCKIGLHDWQQVACCTGDEIDNYAREQVYGKMPIRSCWIPKPVVAIEKVCLRCGKHLEYNLIRKKL